MTNHVQKSIRKMIPLPVRIHAGPVIAYLFYLYYTYFRKNSLNPRVLSIEKTLDHIGTHNLSAVRFGDGEISLMNNADLLFQNKNLELAQRIETIITTNDPRLLICILNVWNNNRHISLHTFMNMSVWSIVDFFTRSKSRYV